ncbi:HNH endonuclease [Duganella sp. Leaf61]|uniref:HNH endonuclease n=1 Tax=Duganella sp. Leaf61 TaxID=1736227 RepID=UPI0009EA32CA|nr:HNH endonuclease signature motif containing protein [Duganella sp. Leaf61]
MSEQYAARVWSLISIEDGARQYGGNQGYDDHVSSRYEYDSAVPNHKQLSIGDLVLIRGRSKLLGVARIAAITSASGQKQRNRCPVCRAVNLKQRTSMTPPWRCVKGHEFTIPVTDSVTVIRYKATFGNSFIECQDGVPVDVLRQAALRPNDQLSIQEIDLGKIEIGLASKYPATRALLAQFIETVVLSPGEADFDANDIAEKGIGEGEMSMIDARRAVLRAIRQRRGQKKFRNLLLKNADHCCQVTGCSVTAILEAAHIDSYRNDTHNQTANGLLLRADIHTLFDLNLMAVDPKDLTLHFHPEVAASGYAAYRFRPLRAGSVMPSREALSRRWTVFSTHLTPEPE